MAATPSITLEIAVDCEPDAVAAVGAGADRLEVCADLAGHGFTPARELVHAAMRAATPAGARIVAMVRPARSDAEERAFVYDRLEWDRVLRDAGMVLEAGAGGIVFGCLNVRGYVEESQVRELVRLAGSAETVFHRAIDLAMDPEDAAKRLADLGVTRVLTSGMSATATAAELRSGNPSAAASAAAASRWQEGGDGWTRRLERIAGLRCAVGGWFEVLPGGGIRAANAAEVIDRTGCRQIHSSGRTAGRFAEGNVAAMRASIDAAL